MPRNFKLDRRTVLRGLGAAVSLPLLEAMLPRRWAEAQTIISPPRYVFATGSVSIGPDKLAPPGYPDAPRGINVPMNTGTNYDIPRGLATISGLKNDITVISGLNIPTSGSDPARVVAATSFAGHYNLVGCAILGRTINEIDPKIPGYNWNTGATGDSADQLLSANLAGPTPHPVLSLRLEPGGIVFNSNEISHKVSGGVMAPHVGTYSPQQLFQTLFGTLVPGLTPTEEERRMMAQGMHVHVVDAVLAKANALKLRLGRGDQIRLEQHLDELRDLQLRVTATPPALTGVCSLPTNPGADPVSTVATNYGMATRVPVMLDLAHKALVCDLTRIVVLNITVSAFSNVNGETLYGHPGTVHFGHHHSDTPLPTLDATWERQADCLAWHVGIWANLMQKLKDTPDANGTMLDRTAGVFMPDNGWVSIAGEASHSAEGFMMLVAGRAGGLVPGQHLAFSGTQHPSSVLLSAIKACGYTGSALGEITTEIPGLRIVS